MEINRRKLEKLTTSIAVTLLSLMVFVLTLVVANYIFKWDLFPESIERIGLVVMYSSFFIIISSVTINIMVNIGRIADKIDSKNED